jgi:phosphinothricin acetyltransferase
MSDQRTSPVGAPKGVVRVAQVGDAGALSAIYAPYVAQTAASFELDPPSADEMAARVRRVGATFPWLVYESDGEVLGYAYASQHKERAAYAWSVDTTVYVAQGEHRRGLGRILYARLLSILTRQGFHQAYGGITLPNAASVGLHEACGYRPIGVYHQVGYKLGAWRDVGWWGRPLATPTGEPSPPLPFVPEMIARI